MANDQEQHTGAQAPQTSAQQTSAQPQGAGASPPGAGAFPPPGSTQATQDAQQDTEQPDDFDGLEGKKPEELTPEELRLMADTMPGEGPGD
jgi:hypothetical protein